MVEEAHRMVGTTYRLIGMDRLNIRRKDGMSNSEMARIARQWTPLENSLIRVNDIIFKNGKPMQFQTTWFNDNISDELSDFLAGVSLSHRAMFVERDGGIFITASTDGNTNIDADLIEAFARALCC